MRYCFIDRIKAIHWDKEITISKATTISEDFYTEHFDGFPVLPGALQIEAMAQACGALIEICSNYQIFSILIMVEKIKFRKMVHPGDQMIIQATVASAHADSMLFNTRIEVDNQVVSAGTMLTGKVYPTDMQSDYSGVFKNLKQYYRFPLRDTVITGKPNDID